MGGARPPVDSPAVDRGIDHHGIVRHVLDLRREGHYVKNGGQTDEIAGIKMALRPLKELYGHTEAVTFGPLKLKAVRERKIAELCATPHHIT